MKKMAIILMSLLLVLAWFVTLTSGTDKEAELKAHYENAVRLEGKGIYYDAAEEYEAALGVDPGNTDIMLRLAHVYKGLNETAAYESMLKQTADAGGEKSDEALEELVNYYVELKSLSTAVHFIAEYHEEHPDNNKAAELYAGLKGSYTLLFCKYPELSGFYSNTSKAGDSNGYLVINASGAAIKEVYYADITPYSFDGYARAVTKEGKTVYLDENGYTRIVPDDNYTDTGMVCSGLISACDGGKYGYLGTDGTKKTEFQWDGLTAVNGSGFAKSGEKWALINSSAEPVTDFIYDGVITDDYGAAFRQGRAFVNSGNGWILLNEKNEKIGENVFDDAKAFSGGGMAAVCKGGKWGFVDTDGNLVIDYLYDDARSFSNGYAAVSGNGAWGYIDETNQLIIDYFFAEATDFSSSGSACVKTIDKDGAEQWDLIGLIIAQQ